MATKKTYPKYNEKDRIFTTQKSASKTYLPKTKKKLSMPSLIQSLKKSELLQKLTLISINLTSSPMKKELGDEDLKIELKSQKPYAN